MNNPNIIAAVELFESTNKLASFVFHCGTPLKRAFKVFSFYGDKEFNPFTVKNVEEMKALLNDEYYKDVHWMVEKAIENPAPGELSFQFFPMEQHPNENALLQSLFSRAVTSDLLDETEKEQLSQIYKEVICSESQNLQP